MKWEYAVHSDTKESDLEDELNGLGRLGWELVSCTSFLVLEGSFHETHEVRYYTSVLKKRAD